MKNISIKINKDAIISEISLATAYAAAKADSNDRLLFERVATIKADDEILHRFWREMTGKITHRLQEFIAATEVTDEFFSMTLEVSGGYDEILSPSVETDLFSCMAAGIISGWFRFSLPQRAAEWMQESDSFLDRAVSKLCHRSKPRRNIK